MEQAIWGNNAIYSHGTNHSKGVAIFFNPRLDYQIIEQIVDDNGRYILININIQGTQFWLSNIYAPNTDAEQVVFFKNMRSLFNYKSIIKEHKIVIGGDFNLTFNNDLDKKGGTTVQTKPQSLKSIKNIISVFELDDIWRIKHPSEQRFTWRQRKPFVQCRLDYWLISNHLQDYTNSEKIIPSIRSDHSAIFLGLKSVQDEKGPNLWKFNNSLLNDKNYNQLINRNVSKWILSEFKDKSIRWEVLKYYIRKETINFSKRKKKIRGNIERALEKDLENIDIQISNMNFIDPSDNILNDKDRIIELLKDIESERIKGAIIRSKVKWYEEGERSSKYFFNLEKEHCKSSTVRKLLNKNGKYVHNPKDILNIQMQFYKDLYAFHDCSNDDVEYLLNIQGKKLSEIENTFCEGELTELECLNALNTFKNNKTPGNDGLTVEFYKHFWPVLGKHLVDSINFSYEHGQMTTSQRQAIIKLLEKKAKIDLC